MGHDDKPKISAETRARWAMLRALAGVSDDRKVSTDASKTSSRNSVHVPDPGNDDQKGVKEDRSHSGGASSENAELIATFEDHDPTPEGESAKSQLQQPDHEDSRIDDDAVNEGPLPVPQKETEDSNQNDSDVKTDGKYPRQPIQGQPEDQRSLASIGSETPAKAFLQADSASAASATHETDNPVELQLGNELDIREETTSTDAFEGPAQDISIESNSDLPSPVSADVNTVQTSKISDVTDNAVPSTDGGEARDLPLFHPEILSDTSEFTISPVSSQSTPTAPVDVQLSREPISSNQLHNAAGSPTSLKETNLEDFTFDQVAPGISSNKSSNLHRVRASTPKLRIRDAYPTNRPTDEGERPPNLPSHIRRSRRALTRSDTASTQSKKATLSQVANGGGDAQALTSLADQEGSTRQNTDISPLQELIQSALPTPVTSQSPAVDPPGRVSSLPQDGQQDSVPFEEISPLPSSQNSPTFDKDGHQPPAEDVKSPLLSYTTKDHTSEAITIMEHERYSSTPLSGLPDSSEEDHTGTNHTVALTNQTRDTPLVRNDISSSSPHNVDNPGPRLSISSETKDQENDPASSEDSLLTSSVSGSLAKQMVVGYEQTHPIVSAPSSQNHDEELAMSGSVQSSAIPTDAVPPSLASTAESIKDLAKIEVQEQGDQRASFLRMPVPDKGPLGHDILPSLSAPMFVEAADESHESISQQIDMSATNHICNESNKAAPLKMTSKSPTCPSHGPSPPSEAVSHTLTYIPKSAAAQVSSAQVATSQVSSDIAIVSDPQSPENRVPTPNDTMMVITTIYPATEMPDTSGSQILAPKSISESQEGKIENVDNREERKPIAAEAGKRPSRKVAEPSQDTRHLSSEVYSEAPTAFLGSKNSGSRKESASTPEGIAQSGAISPSRSNADYPATLKIYPNPIAAKAAPKAPSSTQHQPNSDHNPLSSNVNERNKPPSESKARPPPPPLQPNPVPNPNPNPTPLSPDHGAVLPQPIPPQLFLFEHLISGFAQRAELRSQSSDGKPGFLDQMTALAIHVAEDALPAIRERLVENLENTMRG